MRAAEGGADAGGATGRPRPPPPPVAPGALLPPATGSEPPAGEDGARVRSGPEAPWGLLHVLAEMLREPACHTGSNDRFDFPDSKINANSDCSRETKRAYFWKESDDKPRQCIIIKSRDSTLQTKVDRVKTMAYPAVMYEM